MTRKTRIAVAGAGYIGQAHIGAALDSPSCQLSAIVDVSPAAKGIAAKAEVPLYRVEKRPKLRNRQGMYALVGSEGQVLRRGHDLAAVLRFLDRQAMKVIG